MHADISRDSFDVARRYMRVLMQQGRPLTDADWNEQVAILADREWHLIRSLLGKCHGTFDNGFCPSFSDHPPSVTLCPGSYYVDGLRCDLAEQVTSQVLTSDQQTTYKLFLRAYEQSVNPAMDSGILEPALRGIDSSWRSRVIWQLFSLSPSPPTTAVPARARKSVVKAGEDPKPAPLPSQIVILACPPEMPNCSCAPVDRPLTVRRANLSTGPTNSPCDISGIRPGSMLGEAVYRIEVHVGGKPLLIPADPNSKTSTPCTPRGKGVGQDAPSQQIPDSSPSVPTPMRFKWSRENGAAVYSIDRNVTNPLRLDANRFISKLPLQTGDWLELLDQEGSSRNTDRKLVQVTVQAGEYTLSEPFRPQTSREGAGGILIASSPPVVPLETAAFHVRRWNQCGERMHELDIEQVIRNTRNNLATIGDDGCVVAVADPQNSIWIPLEGGLQIQFDQNACYDEGDVWIVRVSDFTHSGFVPSTPPGNGPAPRRYPLVGKWHYVQLSEISKNDGEQQPLSGWNGRTLTPKNSCQTDDACQKCEPPDQVAIEPAFAPEPAVVEVPRASNVLPASRAETASFLSVDGRNALGPLLATRAVITRRVPARYLNHEPTSTDYRRFRAPLLVSEILEPDVEQYLSKVRRCLPGTEATWETIEKDARTDFALANDFERTLRSGNVSRSPLA